MSKGKYPGESRWRIPLQCGQFFIEAGWQILLDLANGPVNLIVIVEQPFGSFPGLCRRICAGFASLVQPIDGLVNMTPGRNGLWSKS